MKWNEASAAKVLSKLMWNICLLNFSLHFRWIFVAVTSRTFASVDYWWVVSSDSLVGLSIHRKAWFCCVCCVQSSSAAWWCWSSLSNELGRLFCWGRLWQRRSSPLVSSFLCAVRSVPEFKKCTSVNWVCRTREIHWQRYERLPQATADLC